MAPTTITTITQTNSTTYADEVGVLIGLSRLPGETSEAYVKRLNNATRIDTSQDYVGLLNELTLQLGLSIGNVISLTSVSGNPLRVDIALNGIVLTDTILLTTQTIPVVLVDIDDAWTWYLLSDVVGAINAGTIATATLLVADGPTIRISRQSNLLTVIAQPISGQNVNVGYPNVIPGSELFNVPVPTYTPNYAAGTFVFSAPVPTGTQITYKRLVWPYNIIGGDVSIYSLLDPAVGQMAQGPGGTMVYQVQEAVQAIMQQDQSYWAT
jgi:hypothetical protein